MADVCIHCSTPLPDGSHYCAHCGTPVPGRDPESPTLTPQGREIFGRLKDATEGRYEILRELGRGGMAVVFLGHQKSLDRMVAIKVLLPLLAYDPEIVERFMREARTQGKLDHPNIIQVFEVYNEGGLTFFTVPYISGQSLRTLLQEEQRPDIERVRRYLRQAADALAYAHRRGVVHRDVKPDNILIDGERDRVILSDFGIAKALAADSTLTTPGDLLGTPQYMSPEQGEGRRDLDGRADQYSLGLIGYEMLAGRRPFQAENLAELMYQHRFEDPDPIDEVRPDAPLNLRRAISRAISKDRDDRFPTMDDFLAALDAAVVEEPAEAAAADDDLEGADDTTVRVPTPPKMHSWPPVEATAPEATEPPGPGGESDVTEMWTPSKGRVKSGVVTPRPGDVDRSEAALLGTPHAARRPGLPRAVLISGALAGAALIVALFLVGPFRPGSGGRPATGGSKPEMGAQLSPGAALPQGSEEQQATPPTSGGEGPGTTERGGNARETVPATGGEGASGAVAGAVAVPAAVPPARDQELVTGAADGTRDRAANARERMQLEREGAVKAGAAQIDKPGLDELDAQLASADAAFDAGRYSQAWGAYSRLITGYGDLAARARIASQAAADRAESARQARSSVRQQREALVAAGGADVFPGELQKLDGRMGEADVALDEERYEEALGLYTALVSDYQALAGRVTDQKRQAAAAARDEMESQRRAAVSAGAEQRAPDQLKRSDQLRDVALQRLDAGAFDEARVLLTNAAAAYEEIAGSLAAPPPAETPPAAAAAGATAEQDVNGLIARFTKLLGQEDMEGLGSDVYRGSIPDADSGILKAIFKNAEELTSSSTVQKLEVDGTSATADVRLELRFVNARTGQRGKMDLKLRMSFKSDAAGWHLRGFRRR